MILLPLLQNEALEQVSRGFREYPESQSAWALALATLLGVGLLAALVYAFLSGRERMIGRRLFYRMARASGLARPERDLLVLVSRRVLPDNPPAIFVRRSLFESGVAGMPADARVVESTRRKVYGP
ncbi:MAG TPA: hypothetical protein VE981_08650 [Planctomycetota bacterium]|nr:hypothetical protein [Planctomycetota bacterium]